MDDQLEMLVKHDNLTFSQLFVAQKDGHQQRDEKRFSLSEEEKGKEEKQRQKEEANNPVCCGTHFPLN